MIVDASALLFVLLPHLPDPAREEHLLVALQRVLLQEPLEAPSLIAYELGHALHRKRAADVGQDARSRSAALRRLLGLVEQRGSLGEVLEAAGAIAEGSKLSFYDSAYLAHARLAKAPLLTADSGLAAHARSLKVATYLLPEDLPRLRQDYSDEETRESGAEP